MLNELKLMKFFLEMETYGKISGAHKYKVLTNLKLYLIAGKSGNEVMKHFPYEKVLSLGKEQLPSSGVALSGPSVNQN